MSEFSTELRPLFPDQLVSYETYLAHSRVSTLDGYNRGVFNQGLFNLTRLDQDGTTGLDTLRMWSPRLLPYSENKDQYRIRVIKGAKKIAVIKQKEGGNDVVECTINASDIRCVNTLVNLRPQLYKVGESGYLLPPPLGIKIFIHGDLKPEQLDQILLDAQKGVRPKDEFLKHLPLIQTDPKYAGQIVDGIFFDNNFAIGKVKEMPDAAVLTGDGHLLGRRVRYPLSPQNWDLRAELGLVKQPDEAPLIELVST